MSRGLCCRLCLLASFVNQPASDARIQIYLASNAGSAVWRAGANVAHEESGSDPLCTRGHSTPVVGIQVNRSLVLGGVEWCIEGLRNGALV